ncbi:arginase family protein, partial [Bordetella pertussis]|uniref:arginase family protein n=1 Tax=Bordetella pertussis TaxID=520 RepID=UPI000A96464B
GLRRWLDARGDREPVLVLNLDAHFDLRTGRPGSSGTPFDQIAEYCAARGHALQYACLGVSPLGNTPALYARAAEVGAVWVEDRHMQEAHLGERLAQLDTLLAAAGHVYLTIDHLAECNPAYDIDHRTARVAARLAWRLLGG